MQTNKIGLNVTSDTESCLDVLKRKWSETRPSQMIAIWLVPNSITGALKQEYYWLSRAIQYTLFVLKYTTRSYSNIEGAVAEGRRQVRRGRARATRALGAALAFSLRAASRPEELFADKLQILWLHTPSIKVDT